MTAFTNIRVREQVMLPVPAALVAGSILLVIARRIMSGAAELVLVMARLSTPVPAPAMPADREAPAGANMPAVIVPADITGTAAAVLRLALWAVF